MSIGAHRLVGLQAATNDSGGGVEMLAKVLIGLVLLLPASAGAQEDRLAWLTGRWVGTVGGAYAEEQWSEVSAGARMGMFRWVEDGKVDVYEFLLIRDLPDGGLEMLFKHFRDDLTGWEEKDDRVRLTATRVTDGEVVFERVEPFLRIIYRRDGADALVSILERGTRDAPDRSVFDYRRAR
jgi:hypothetical protein